MADDLGDRTEAPTARRLSEARQRGQVAKSTDLAAVAALAAGIACVLAFGEHVGRTVTALTEGMMSGRMSAETHFLASSASGDLARAMAMGGFIAAPFLGVALLVAVASHMGQTGFLFTTKPLEPKLDRLDPIKGFGRIAGMKNLIRSLMTIAKATLVGIVASAVLGGRFDRLAVLPRLGAAQAMAVIAETALDLAIWLIAVMLVLGVADFLYQRWQHTRDLRMTKQQVKEEREDQEGNPEVKRRQRELYRKIAANQVRSATPRADVVITNPTHFAVAIAYDAGEMRAPRVTAKGADLLAMEMRRLAREHGVPLVERPPLARALYWNVDVGAEVRAEHYEAVAEVLAYVYRTDERAAERRAARARSAAARAGSRAA